MLLAGLPAWAQSVHGIGAGMGYDEVIKVMGMPLEREEREITREDVWRYPKFQVIFREGRVSGFYTSKGRVDLAAADHQGKGQANAASRGGEAGGKGGAKDEVTLDEILADIMSGPEDGSSVESVPKIALPPAAAPVPIE